MRSAVGIVGGALFVAWLGSGCASATTGGETATASPAIEKTAGPATEKTSGGATEKTPGEHDKSAPSDRSGFSFAVYGDSRSMMYLPYQEDQKS
jgi:hypothetical protein